MLRFLVTLVWPRFSSLTRVVGSRRDKGQVDTIVVGTEAQKNSDAVFKFCGLQQSFPRVKSREICTCVHFIENKIPVSIMQIKFLSKSFGIFCFYVSQQISN